LEAIEDGEMLFAHEILAGVAIDLPGAVEAAEAGS
jgi:hypothetical protein